MRLLKILAAAALLAAGAAAAHFSPHVLHRMQEQSLQGLASQGVEIASGLHPFDAGSRSDASDPFQLRILSKVAYYVGEDYVDQARVDPDKMLKATMNALQRGVAEIQVEYLPGDVMKVHVGAQERTFPAKVKDIDDMVERLKQVFAFFKEALPEQPEPQDLEYAAIGGMLSTLDPHSVLLPPDVYAEMKLSTSGEFGGLGIVIAVRESSLTVISLLEDTPASRGGIHGGDKIVRIGEESTVNMNLEEAVKKLRGPKGSAVTIAISRKGWSEPKEFTLVRDVIKIVNVEGQLLSDDVAYIRVKGFQENTGEDVQKQTTIAQTALNIGATYGKPGNDAYAALTAALSGKYDALAKMGMTINDAAIDGRARGRFNDMQEEGKREARFAYIQEQVKGQKTGKLRGVVLDLRNNPGGLLDEAIKLSDLYLESGPIVTTVGVGNKLRDEKDAKWPGTDRETPVIVLTNGGSASASEIVAGALKNRDRAVILGEQTFGKGSVQNLFDLRDGSALKLTIAKYLTPGDISIQSVGVTPDIETTPVKIAADHVDLTGESHKFRETDLGGHFDNDGSGIARHDKPALTMRFIENEDAKPAGKYTPLNPKEGHDKPKSGAEVKDKDDGAKDEAGNDDDDIDPEYKKAGDLSKDFEVQLATQILKADGSPSRKKMLAGAPSIVSKSQAEQDQHIAEQFRQLGIDWTAGHDTGTPKLATSVEFTPSENSKGPVPSVLAGDDCKLTVNVTNKGTTDVTRLRGISKSDEPIFDGIEFAFGRVKPGQTRSFTIPMKMPKAWPASVTNISIDLERGDEAPILTIPAKLGVRPLPHPSFAYSWQILDNAAGGNGDGIAEMGEWVDMSVSVTNLGPGEAPDPVALLKNLEGEALNLDKGRIKFDPLAPGKSAEGKFRFQVKDGFAKAAFDVRLTVADATFGDYVTEKLELPTGPRRESVAAATGSVSAIGATPVYSGASEKTLTLAQLKPGATLAQKGKLGNFVQVSLPDGRLGWIEASKVSATGRPASAEGLEVVRMSPPKLTVGPPKSTELVLRGEKTSVQGTASDDIGMKDMWIMVNDKKVFYRTFPADAPARDPVSFNTDLPLEKGQNRVVIIARDKNDLESTSSFSIRRETEEAKPNGKTQSRTP